MARTAARVGVFTESVIREMTRLAMEHGALNLARVKLRDQQRLAHGPLKVQAGGTLRTIHQRAVREACLSPSPCAPLKHSGRGGLS